jgi:hypothetical protein
LIHALSIRVAAMVVACLGILTRMRLRLYAAVTPSLPVAPGAQLPSFRPESTPPGYTQIAPIFLKTDGGSVSARRIASDGDISGGSTEPTLS